MNDPLSKDLWNKKVSGYANSDPYWQRHPTNPARPAWTDVKAFLRGYISFAVNGTVMKGYTRSCAVADAMIALGLDPVVIQQGYHIFRGWQTLYIQYNMKAGIDVSSGPGSNAPTISGYAPSDTIKTRGPMNFNARK